MLAYDSFCEISADEVIPLLSGGARGCAPSLFRLFPVGQDYLPREGSTLTPDICYALITSPCYDLGGRCRSASSQKPLDLVDSSLPSSYVSSHLGYVPRSRRRSPTPTSRTV